MGPAGETDEDPRRLRIGFLNARDSTDRRTWSGLLWSMSDALQRHCGEVVRIGPTRPMVAYAGGAASRLAQRWTRPLCEYQYAPILARAYGRWFTRRVAEADVDVLFAPSASSEIAYLETDLPIVYCGDATLPLLWDYYREFTGWSETARRGGSDTERRALRRADACVFPSRWAADSAVRDYGVDPARVAVFPFGVNVDEPPGIDEILRLRAPRPRRVLFMPTFWHRKGGDVVLAAFRLLRRRGLDVALDLLGAQPAEPLDVDRVRVLGWIDKNDPAKRALLRDTLLSAHAMIMPTRADCLAMPACEAAAYGVPSVVRDTGGTSAVVIPGENGELVPPEAGPEAYADALERLLAGDHEDQARRARALYDRAFTWRAWSRSIGAILRRVVGQAWRDRPRARLG